MNIVISDPETGRAYSKKVEKTVYAGRKIGDSLKLDELGLHGYEALITGGSDKDGFPMSKKIHGTGRRKILLRNGFGLKKKVKGIRMKKSLRGNTVSNDTQQLNLKIVKKGPMKIEELFQKSEVGNAAGKKEQAENKDKDEAAAVNAIEKEKKPVTEKGETKKNIGKM